MGIFVGEGEGDRDCDKVGGEVRTMIKKVAIVEVGILSN